LTLQAATDFVNNELVADEKVHLEAHHLSLPITEEMVRCWLKKAGAVWDKAQQSYYNQGPQFQPVPSSTLQELLFFDLSFYRYSRSFKKSTTSFS